MCIHIYIHDQQASRDQAAPEENLKLKHAYRKQARKQSKQSKAAFFQTPGSVVHMSIYDVNKGVSRFKA